MNVVKPRKPNVLSSFIFFCIIPIYFLLLTTVAFGDDEYDSDSLSAVDYYYQGNESLRNNEIEAAKQLFTLSIEEDMNYSKAYAGRGMAQYLLGDTNAALADCLYGIEVQPKSPYSYVVIGYINQDMGDNDKAMTFYNKALEIDSTHIDAYYNRALLKISQEDTQGAIEDFDKAISLDDGYVDAYYGRGFVKQSLGRYREATKDYKTALSLAPARTEVYLNKALAEIELGNNRNAKRDVDKALKLEPDNYLGYVIRGNILMSEANDKDNPNRVKSLKNARENYDKAIELNDQYLEAYYYRALNSYELRYYDSAIKDLTKAAEINPKEAYLFTTKGNYEARIGEYLKAILSHQTALGNFFEESNPYLR